MKILQLAIRTLLRFRLYTMINIIGLALSLACCIIISRYVYRESTVDSSFSNMERIYLTARQQQETNRLYLFSDGSLTFVSFSVKPLKEPEVEKATTFVSLPEVNISVDNRLYNIHILAVDSLFLQILDYPLVAGERNTVLSKPESAVITQHYAKKVFGDQNPLGKQISYNGNMITITGVLREPDSKCSLVFDMLLSVKLQWRWPPVLHYSVALMAPEADMKQLNKKMQHADAKWEKENKYYQFVSLKDLYFNKSIDRAQRIFLHSSGEGTFLKGNKTHIIILLAIAILILLVGIFNFINIYTVMMLKRGREFGMKKVFGVNARQLFVQLFIENIIQIVLALFLGWVVIELTKGVAETQLGIGQESNILFDLLLSVILISVLPVLTTLYPFIKYNYSTPITSLKGIEPGSGSSIVRPLLLGIQYVITFCIIVFSLFFMKQLDYMLHADLGYKTTDIILMQFQRNSTKMSYTLDEVDAEQRLDDEITQKINASPLFSCWSKGVCPYEYSENNSRVCLPGNEYQYVTYVKSTEKYFNLYNIQLKEGRSWDKELDQFQENNLIINESAAKLLGIKDINTDQLQAERKLYRSENNDNPPCKIIGIVKDFKTNHLSKATIPLVFTYEKAYLTEKFMASVIPGKKQEAIAFLEKLHNEMIGGEFEYAFLEDEIKILYQDDKRVTIIYSVFALIAILISSMGLFGLSLFDVQHRYREIALRKINGATVSIIMRMLLRKYYLLLGIAFVIATPLSLLTIIKWQEDFANKTPLSWWLFVVAALGTAAISLATLIFQIRKAANSNPMDILKGE